MLKSIFKKISSLAGLSFRHENGVRNSGFQPTIEGILKKARRLKVKLKD
jgi:hypothetical protein